MANKRGQGEGSISKLPNGTWWARVTVGKDENGKQLRKAYYGKTRKEVQQKLTESINEVNHGTYIEPSKMTLEQWLIIWLKEYKKNSLKITTYKNYCTMAYNHIIPAIGKCSLKDLRVDMIQKLINDKVDAGLSRSVRHISIVIKGALKQAVKNDLIKKNVALDITLPQKERPKREILTKEEQARFITATKDSTYGDVYILILGTGLRIGEALALTWDDIDFKECNLRVSKALHYMKKDYDDKDAMKTIIVDSPKTKSSNRTIPLLPSIVEMLKAIRQDQQMKMESGMLDNDHNIVFCGKRGAYWNPVSINSGFKRLITRLGFDPALTVHGLRHTFATRGMENGVELKVMQELLGHSSIGITADLYTHVLPEKKKDSVMKLVDTINLTEDLYMRSQVTCKICGGRDLQKRGKRKGFQRYLCNECGHVFEDKQND